MRTNAKFKEILEFAMTLSKSIHDVDSFHNAILGVGGKADELFKTPEERKKFIKSGEYAMIKELKNQIRSSDNALVRVTLRVPKGTHQLLDRELSEHDDIKSLNDLMCLKLAAPVEAVV